MPWLAALAVGVGAGLLLSSPAFLTRFSDPLAPLQGAVGLEALGPGRFHGAFQRPAASSLPDLDDRLAALRGKAGTRGVLDLLEDLPEAVRSLEDQARSQPDSATAWSDLAAAYLTRGAGSSANEDPLDVLAALRAALTATQLDPEHPEAAFNFAESLTRCGLKHEAFQAWNRYLDLDPSSAWTSLALDRRKRLAAPTHDRRWNDQGRPTLLAALAAGNRDEVRDVVDRFRTRSREWLLNEAFPGWGRAAEASDTSAAAVHREEIHLVAEVLAELTGDELLLDAARTLPNDLLRARALAQVLAPWPGKNGSLEAWQATSEGLRRMDSPLAAWAAYQAERLGYNAGRPTAKANLTQLAADLEDKPYPMVRSSIEGLLGVIAGIEDDPERALEHYAAGRNLAERSEGSVAAQPFDLLDASALDRLGRRRDAWRAFFSAIEGSARVGDRFRIYGPLLTAADVLGEARETDLAGPFVAELLTNARGSGQSALLSESFASAGRQAAAAGRWAEAERLFGTALAEARKVEATLAPRLVAYSRLAQGSTRIAAAPEAAKADLEAALSHFQGDDFRYYESETLLALGRTEEQLGRPILAAERYREAIDAQFERRRRLRADEARLFTVDRLQSAFDSLITLELDALDSVDAAFGTADRSKALGLAEALKAASLANPEEIRGHLPEDLALIQYAALPDRLAIWVVQRQGSAFRSAPVPRDALNRAVADFREALRTRHGVPEAKTRLSQWLWAPISSLVSPETRLLIVPDGALGDVPWAGLDSDGRGRPLVADHEISVAPSAALARHLLARPWQAPRSVLVVADPAFSAREFPSLERLPNAEMEGYELAFRFPPAARRLLTGRAADQRAFLDHAPGIELIHFAGHGIGEGDSPADSSLVFAPDEAKSDSQLPAWKIAAMDWSGTRLVVLSSCQGVQSGVIGRQVLTGLATAFLAGGVPTLVANPEPVTDQVTRAFMRYFYDALEAGQRPAQALRTAQLQMIQSSLVERNQPKSWASWIVIGAP